MVLFFRCLPDDLLGRNDLQPIPSFEVSWGLTSSEEAYRGSQFTIQGVFVSLTIGVVTVWTVPFGMIALNVRAPTVL